MTRVDIILYLIVFLVVLILRSFTTNLCCLQKCLTTLDLTSLGVGSCCGTGMYLVAGMVAKTIAGPGVVLSFFIAAVASIFSGKMLSLCALERWHSDLS